MDKAEIIPPLGVIFIMFIILLISLFNDYKQVFNFALGIIIGSGLYLCYLFYKEFKKSRKDIKS
ncbi:MAG: hypothetical protein R6W84_06410 [Promethearchaeia archaeon]